MCLAFDCQFRYPSGFELVASFEAGAGVTALIGPSGAGKTTVLHLIAGILRPGRGRIVLAGNTLVDIQCGVFLPPEQRKVGVVFQEHLLFPHLRVKANLTFGQFRADSRPVQLDRVVEILEIGDLLERYPATLSGGQKQRVALGRALLRGPDLLLMDEPLTALDAELKERIIIYLERALSEWRVPTILVSHDVADVHKLANQTVVMEHGKVMWTKPSN